MKGIKRIFWIIALIVVGLVVGYFIYTGVNL